LLRLVVGRQGAVEQPAGGEQPALPVGLPDEGIVTGDRVEPLGLFVGAVARVAIWDEVGDVLAGPLALVLVPPHVLLPVRPRPRPMVRRARPRWGSPT